MLKSLDELRMGLVTPKAFTSEVKLRRTIDLNIATFTSMSTINTAGITTLDIEKVDERYLLCGGKNGTVAIYDLVHTSDKYSYTPGIIAHICPSLETHQFTVVKVQWYPFDTGLFTTSSKCRTLKIWDTNCLKAVDSIKLDYHLMHHDMSSVATHHNLIAVATTDPRVQLYDAKGGLATHQLKGHQAGVECVAFSPVAENLLASGGTDNRILLWDIRSAKGFLKCFDQHNSKSFGNTTFRNQSNLPTAHDSQVRCIKFTDDGLYLVSQSSEKDVLLWDVAYARNTLVNYSVTLPREYYGRLPFTFEVCSDTSLPVLFIPANNDIDVSDMYTGIRYKSLVGHFNFVYCCVYKSSTQELYSGGNDLNIIKWSHVGDEGNEKELDTNPKKGDNWSDSD